MKHVLMFATVFVHMSWKSDSGNKYNINIVKNPNYLKVM